MAHQEVVVRESRHIASMTMNLNVYAVNRESASSAELEVEMKSQSVRIEK